MKSSKRGKKEVPIETYNEVYLEETGFSEFAKEETFETYANLTEELPFETFGEEPNEEEDPGKESDSDYSGYRTQEDDPVATDDEEEETFECMKQKYEEDVKLIRQKFLNQCMILPHYYETLKEEEYLPE